MSETAAEVAEEGGDDDFWTKGRYVAAFMLGAIASLSPLQGVAATWLALCMGLLVGLVGVRVSVPLLIRADLYHA